MRTMYYGFLVSHVSDHIALVLSKTITCLQNIGIRRLDVSSVLLAPV